MRAEWMAAPIAVRWWWWWEEGDLSDNNLLCRLASSNVAHYTEVVHWLGVFLGGGGGGGVNNRSIPELNYVRHVATRGIDY